MPGRTRENLRHNTSTLEGGVLVDEIADANGWLVINDGKPSDALGSGAATRLIGVAS